MVRDLVEESIRLVKDKKIEEVYEKGKKLADDKIVDILLPLPSKSKVKNPLEILFGGDMEDEDITISEKEEEIIIKRKELKEKLIKRRIRGQNNRNRSGRKL